MNITTVIILSLVLGYWASQMDGIIIPADMENSIELKVAFATVGLILLSLIAGICLLFYGIYIAIRHLISQWFECT